MKIQHNNIEQWMFDYFEGNLSHQEKDILLNYIHQNPEYGPDFTQWAQSYAHIGEPINDYKLTDSLLQTPTQKPIYTKPIVWVSSALILLSLGYYLVNLNYSNSSKPIFNQSTQPKNPILDTSKIVIQNNQTLVCTKQYNKVPKQELFKKDTLVPTVETTEITSQNTILEPQIIENKQAGDTVINSLPQSKDSSNSIKRIERKNQKETTKRKKKNFLNLRTDPEFIEENPNF